MVLGACEASEPQALEAQMAIQMDANGQDWLTWFCDEALQPGELAAVLDELAR